jgi:hypothetical protein
LVGAFRRDIMKNLRPGDAFALLIKSRLEEAGWKTRIYGPGSAYGDEGILTLDDDIKIHVTGLWVRAGHSFCINISPSGDRFGYDLAPVKMPKIEVLRFKQRISLLWQAFTLGQAYHTWTPDTN